MTALLDVSGLARATAPGGPGPRGATTCSFRLEAGGSRRARRRVGLRQVHDRAHARRPRAARRRAHPRLRPAARPRREGRRRRGARPRRADRLPGPVPLARPARARWATPSTRCCGCTPTSTPAGGRPAPASCSARSVWATARPAALPRRSRAASASGSRSRVRSRSTRPCSSSTRRSRRWTSRCRRRCSTCSRTSVATTGIGLVFVSHDLAVVRYVCDEALVMHRGRVVEQGSDRGPARPRRSTPTPGSCSRRCPAPAGTSPRSARCVARSRRPPRPTEA